MGSFKANLNSAHLIMFSLLVLLLPASATTPTTTPPTCTTRYASSMSASVYSTLAPMDALRAPPSAAQRGPATRSPATTTATRTPTLAAPENFGMSTNNVPGTLNWQ